jgi:hypothetical protein
MRRPLGGTLSRIVYSKALDDGRHRIPMRLSDDLDPQYAATEADSRMSLRGQAVSDVSVRTDVQRRRLVTHVDGNGPNHLVTFDTGHFTPLAPDAWLGIWGSKCASSRLDFGRYDASSRPGFDALAGFGSRHGRHSFGGRISLRIAWIVGVRPLDRRAHLFKRACWPADTDASREIPRRALHGLHFDVFPRS